MLVLLSDIVSLVDNHLKPLRSGEQLMKAGYIVKYGILRQTQDEILITGLCLQSTNVREKPHEMNILLKFNSTE